MLRSVQLLVINPLNVYVKRGAHLNRHLIQTTRCLLRLPQMSGTTTNTDNLPPSSSTSAGAQSISTEPPTNRPPNSTFRKQRRGAVLARLVDNLHLSSQKTRPRPEKGAITITAKTVLAAIGTIVGTLLAGLALWPSFVGVDVARKANLLAQWTARKDFYEFCEEVCLTLCAAPVQNRPGGPP